MSEKQTGRPGPQEPETVRTQKPASSATLDLVAAKLTDVGRARPHNEDYVDYYIPPDARQLERKGAIYLVADGMGGHQAGEVASQGAVELVIGQYYSDTTHDVGTSLVRAFRAANQQIHAQAQSDPSKGGMGTTLVAAVILGRKVYVANVGDSRAYLVNEQGITQITEDHSWVEEQVRAGLLSPEQAKRHPQRNLVTRALGSKPAVEVDLFEGEISAGDALLLCSDGLTGRVEDHELAATVQEHPPQHAAKLLVDLANERGGNDNISVLVVSAQLEPATVKAPVLAPAPKEPARRSPLVPVLAGVAAILVLVAAGALFLTGTIQDWLGGGPTPPLSPTVPTETATATADLPPTAEVSPATDEVVSPAETTPAPTEGMTSTLPTATLKPTETPPTPSPTSTRRPPAVSRTPTNTPEPGGLPAPTLEAPAPDEKVQGEVTFRWRYPQSLSPGAAFEVVIWRQGDAERNGADQPVVALEQTINLDFVDRIKNNGGSGYYLWSVRVIRQSTGERLSPLAQPPRRFEYLGSQPTDVPGDGPTTEPDPTEGPPPAADPCENFVCTQAQCCGSIVHECCSSKCPSGFCP